MLLGGATPKPRRQRPRTLLMMGDEREIVELREVVETDLPVFFQHQLDPEANRMAGFSPRARDAFMAHWAGILRDDSGMAKTVLVDGEVAGNVVSFEMEGQRLVGYWIGKRYWGKGVATRALSTFLELETARPLHARVAASNVASIRVLEKCGFAVAGRVKAGGIEELSLELT
jgi:RimJ/RimL family protein N-acetyltransferase